MGGRLVTIWVAHAVYSCRRSAVQSSGGVRRKSRRLQSLSAALMTAAPADLWGA